MDDMTDDEAQDGAREVKVFEMDKKVIPQSTETVNPHSPSDDAHPLDVFSMDKEESDEFDFRPNIIPADAPDKGVDVSPKVLSVTEPAGSSQKKTPRKSASPASVEKDKSQDPTES